MDGRAVAFVLGNLAVILGLALLMPLGVAVVMDSQSPYETREIVAFATTSAVVIVIGLAARYVFKKWADRVRLREGFAIVTFSWVLMSLIGMVPYLLTGVTDSVADAFFETMSGFTTTGASIFPKVEILPHGLQFWRCMTQWLGGMGVVVLSVALLPILGVGGYRLLKAESPGGVAYEREQPRITDAAKELWFIYLLLSGVLAVLLKLSGMSVYDAVCHSFTTMSTGGFSSHTESIAYFPSPFTQWVIIVFMFLAGANFSLHAHMLRRNFTPVWKNSELRLYVTVVVAAIVIGVLTVPSGSGFERHVRDVAFQVISVGTTTGYASTDFNLWPHAMRLVLVLMMFAGGCMGSTAGGMKMARLLIYGKAVVRELNRLIFPHAVRPLRMGSRVLDPAMVGNIMAFGAIYSLSFVLGTVVLALYGYGLVTSATASAAALGNIGPGLMAVGPSANWAHLPDLAKWVMSLLMLLGRLELFSVLVLFTPWLWRR